MKHISEVVAEVIAEIEARQERPVVTEGQKGECHRDFPDLTGEKPGRPTSSPFTYQSI
jgi:hypothetical protein